MTASRGPYYSIRSSTASRSTIQDREASPRVECRQPIEQVADNNVEDTEMKCSDAIPKRQDPADVAIAVRIRPPRPGCPRPEAHVCRVGPRS